MRHRLQGRHLGRNSSHRRALMRNLAKCLFLTIRADVEGAAKASGRICTTLAKAKEVRPFVEKLITLAVRARHKLRQADNLISTVDRGSDGFVSWRASVEGQAWLKCQSEYICYRRRLFDVLRCDDVVVLLIEKIASRFENRPGGYTRVVRIARRRLADAAQLAFLEIVGEPARMLVAE